MQEKHYEVHNMINVDISNFWGDYSLNDLLDLEKEVFAAHRTLIERKGPGADFLGWMELPVFVWSRVVQKA